MAANAILKNIKFNNSVTRLATSTNKVSFSTVIGMLNTLELLSFSLEAILTSKFKMAAFDKPDKTWDLYVP